MDAAVTTDAGHVSFQMFVGNYVGKKLLAGKSQKENAMKRRANSPRTTESGGLLEVFLASVQRGGRVGSLGGYSP